jgi:hypothetical protein
MTVLFELFLKFIASAFFASLALIILFLLVRPLALFSNQSSMSLLSYLMVCLLAVSFVLLFLTPNFVAAVLFAWLRYLFLQSIWRLFDQVHVDWCLANVSLFEREKSTSSALRILRSAPPPRQPLSSWHVTLRDLCWLLAYLKCCTGGSSWIEGTGSA